MNRREGVTYLEARSIDHFSSSSRLTLENTTSGNISMLKLARTASTANTQTHGRKDTILNTDAHHQMHISFYTSTLPPTHHLHYPHTFVVVESLAVLGSQFGRTVVRRINKRFEGLEEAEFENGVVCLLQCIREQICELKHCFTRHLFSLL